MKRVVLVSGLVLLGGCQPSPDASESNVGKYQIVVTAEGTMRIDTETGKTHLAVPTDAIPSGAYATINGKPLVWYEVHTQGALSY